MSKMIRFTLQLSKRDDSSFRAACARLGVTRTGMIRAFCRQFVKLGSADFGVVAVDNLRLDDYIRQMGGK